MKMIPCRWDRLGTTTRLTVCGRLAGGVELKRDGSFRARVAKDYTKYLEKLPDGYSSREEAKRAVERELGVREIEEGRLMKCWRCGQELTTGDGHDLCSGCWNELKKKISDPVNTEPQPGWICPVCGRGVAPWMPTCPCNSEPKPPYVITAGQTWSDVSHGENSNG